MQASIEQTIERVEQLFTMITGRRPSDVEERRAAIPPEIDPIVHVEQQIARMMTTLAQIVSRTGANPMWIPRAVVLTDEQGVAYLLDVPGVAREQIEVNLAGTALTVSGYRHPALPRETRGTNGELPWGTFARTFPVPPNITQEQVSTRLEHGVLTLRIGQKRGTTSQVSVS